MTRAEIARQAAIDRVGDGYVYGAWDQYCTVQARNKYAKLTDTYAEQIKKQCQRMNGKKSTCDGCRYNGRRIHDCRGLTSTCAKLAGIPDITGQTVAKQWKQDVWERKGTIETLPKELPYVQLFRYDGTLWKHTGIWIGDGETVDARSHAKGVVRGKLADYPWTHWAVPRGMYDAYPTAETYPTAAAVPPSQASWEGKEEDERSDAVIWTGVVNTASGRLNVRTGPGEEYGIIGRLPKGETVDVFAERDGWAYIAGDGLQGYVSLAFIKRTEAPESAQDAPEGPGDESVAPPAEPPENAVLVGVWIPCYSEAEAQRYAGNIKGAVILRADRPPE